MLSGTIIIIFDDYFLSKKGQKFLLVTQQLFDT